MKQVKVKIIQYGTLAQKIDYKKIGNHKSSIFKVITCDCHPYMPDCDNGVDFVHYSDEQWERLMPKNNHEADFIFGITDFALDYNFYSRPVRDKSVIFSFRNIRDCLNEANIPLENVIIQQLYAYCIYLSQHESLRTASICHDETRGCIYDKNGAIVDIALSCNQLNLCGECQNTLLSWGFTKKEVKNLVKELTKVKKPLFYRMLDWIKRHPILAIIISFIFSILSDLASSGILALWQKFME